MTPGKGWEKTNLTMESLDIHPALIECLRYAEHNANP